MAMFIRHKYTLDLFVSVFLSLPKMRCDIPRRDKSTARRLVKVNRIFPPLPKSPYSRVLVRMSGSVTGSSSQRRQRTHAMLCPFLMYSDMPPSKEAKHLTALFISVNGGNTHHRGSPGGFPLCEDLSRLVHHLPPDLSHATDQCVGD